MAKILDFNTFEQPTLKVVMRDANKTVFNVTAPTEELIERLEANRDAIAKQFKDTNSTYSNLNALYNFVAEFISINTEGIKVTGEELKNLYRVNYLMLAGFFVAYLDFIEEIKSQKN